MLPSSQLRHCFALVVEQTGKNTFFGRTATLLQSVETLGNLQKILMRVVIVLLVRLLPFCPLLADSARSLL